MGFFLGTSRTRNVVFAAACLLAAPLALGAVGDTVAVVTVPVPAPGGIGIGIAVDCQGPANLYYTNTNSPMLHKMDAAGTPLGSVPMVDSATGAAISFGAIAWDEGRGVLWGGTDASGLPVLVYQIDPVTGIATFQFPMNTPGCCGFCDGITYDPSDDTVYVTDDVDTVIDQHSAATGAWIRTLTPTDAGGAPLGLISGVMVGAGDLLYLGRNGLGLITQVKKSDGSFVGEFASPGGRDEDLECDVVSFAPLTVVWSKDAFNDQVTAIEVEPGTCACGGGEPPPVNRIDVTQKGSLLIFPKIEIKWDAAGNVTQDTFLDMANDYPKDVFVQLYFVNGDEPADPVFAGDPPQLIERGHSGWNWVDCQVRLTNDQPMYWSALTGSPLGCQMFTVLDPGTPPGRPDLDGAPGSRVLRGFVYAWAVDQFGEEICWNHLKGDAVIVNYADPSAWEYNVYAARTSDECELGDAPDGKPGLICLNGSDYSACYDKLLLDFYASGSTALSGGGATVQVDTDLTLFPVDADLRQDTCGPVVTKAKFDIWNMNEIRFSGTTRCITCWDQTLLSNYDPPNHFLLGNLHTDKGKARIDGIASQVCDANDCDHCEWPKHPSCSQDAPLLGVVKKELAFSGGTTGRAAAGMTLVGMGEESTCIQYDIIEPPEELQGQLDHEIAPVEDVSQARIKVRK